MSEPLISKPLRPILGIIVSSPQELRSLRMSMIHSVLNGVVMSLVVPIVVSRLQRALHTFLLEDIKRERKSLII